MARKKKNLGLAQPSSGSGGGHLSASIDEAENGFIANVSGDTGGKMPSYFSKRFIARTRPEALRIANAHLAAGTKAKGGRKGGRKRAVAKGL